MARVGLQRRLLRWVLFAGTAAVILLAVFVAWPRFLDAGYRKELLAVEELARRGPVEEAIAGFTRIEHAYPGTATADRATREREELEQYVSAATGMKRRADEAFKSGDYEEALKLYQLTTDRYPLSRKAGDARGELPNCLRAGCEKLSAAAKAASEARRWQEAKALYERVLTLDKSYAGAEPGLQTAAAKLRDFERLFAAATQAEKQRDWPSARSAYEQALAISPESSAARQGRVRALRNIPPPPGMALILPGDSLVSISNPKPDAPAYRAWHTDGFYMDVAEVTNAEYARFVAAAGAKPPPHWGAVRPPEGAAGLPVVCVTCEEAAAYAAWAGKRLPTDAEWERAARGPSGRLYPWGETFTGAEAVLAREPLPPGSRPADKTEEGCLDMGGNVSEWTADDTPAPSAVSEDKSISRSSLSPPRQARPFKVVRGASWAGLERDRTERFVPLNAATAKSDPARIVLVDMPGLRGIEARAFVETAFFYRATVNDTPVIEIRRWIPELRRTVSGSFEIQPGREIAGERTVPFGMEQGAATRRIQLATGCRLIRVLNPDDPTGQRIEYTDSEGRTQEMARIPKRPGDAAKIEEFLPGSDEIRIPDAIVRELYGRSVNAAVRNNARLFAPGDGRYINCGFRCAKDLP